MNITKLTAHEIRDGYKNKAFTVKDVVEAFYKNIDEKDGDIKAYITLCKDNALKEADEKQSIIDGAISNGTFDELPLLYAIPIAIKDNMNTLGVKTTCASKMLENFVSPYDATVIKKIKEEGAIILGKVNMDEFAMGGSCENSAFFATKNPYDLTRVPGGSSGGSSAAVAGDLAPIALGSDTGGSIREPASLCGIVGLKPTYGLVSRYGLVAFASSLDQIGPMSKDVKDAAILLNAIVGHDEMDSTSANIEKKDYTKALINDVKGIRIGIPKEFYGEGLQEEVRVALEKAKDKYKELGAEIVEVSLPFTKYALPTYYVLACAEASSNLGRFDGIRYGYRTQNYESLKDIYKNSRSEGFGKEVKRRILLGTYVLSAGYYDAYYKKAQKVRTAIKEGFDKVFTECDVILTPTCPTTAWKIGAKTENPLEMYLMDLYTVPVNIAGIPGISIPCGKDNDGMPIGMQLLAKHFNEEVLLRTAYTYEMNKEV
ncbi:MAG: Asp-tRNA(Asn)/Glu-tRNA(Gln) amidotransferase subunit GatA [Clostridia bacterium]|nr:Asp-tRNA(Asn)/Glu-tRNA(Gln) amidotransferase subunit GatA [Clostridia bacterium]